jgi:cyclophilin family peptidyl-prolyl cis-trans isomerase
MPPPLPPRGRATWRSRLSAAAAALLLLLSAAAPNPTLAASTPTPSSSSHTTTEPKLSDERCVFETDFGPIEFGFYPHVAPVTAAHIFRLCALGAYTGNHFFRVDKGFVAQVADVLGGRNLTMSPEIEAEADRTVPLEVQHGVVHTAGVVSMGRHDDPNSGKSSFSVLLGNAPHLDMQYTIFGRVTRGMDALRKMENGVETRREGIFVMPKERVHIYATHWRYASVGGPPALGAAHQKDDDGTGGGVLPLPNRRGTGPIGGGAEASGGGGGEGTCQEELDHLRSRFDWQAQELEAVRKKCLPGR